MKNNKNRSKVSNLDYLIYNINRIKKEHCLDADDNICKYAYAIKEGVTCTFDTCCYCDDCSFKESENLLRFLKEEYRPTNKINISKFEYDMIMSVKETKTIYSTSFFNDYKILVKMKEKGYFKNIELDFSMAYILKNMEVIK